MWQLARRGLGEKPTDFSAHLADYAASADRAAAFLHGRLFLKKGANLRSARKMHFVDPQSHHFHFWIRSVLWDFFC